jgi:hypothetical protein
MAICSFPVFADTPSKPQPPGGDLPAFLASFYSQQPGSTYKFVQSIDVISPGYCSSVRGDVNVVIKAPGMTTLRALCWQQPTRANRNPWGHDVNLAPALTLDSDGNGEFVFHADSFPHGPINVRLYAKSNTDSQDYCELQLFNSGGVVWNEGIPKKVPPAAEGMKLAFADDFDGPLSISGDRSSTTARYWTHWGGGDGSAWPFNDNTGPINPFSRIGTYLRIHANRPAGTAGATGNLCALNEPLKAPCYLECRFLCQDAIGVWPAFWTVAPSKDPSIPGTDEMDVIEAYGTNRGASGLWTGYHVTTHFWGQTDPAWSTAKSADGKLLHPAYSVIQPILLGGKSSWSTTFHTYGLLVTKKDTVYYFDNIEVYRHPSGVHAANDPIIFLIDYALGGGWPVDLSRYGNQSDMWVDYVRTFQGS